MKKVLIILFLNTILCSSSFAESYYFNKCQLTNILYADYLIDLDKNIIKVKLEAADGTFQEFSDPIEIVKKEKIISKKIKSGKSEDNYFVYYLDAKTKSIVKQNYKKEIGLGLVRPIGPKKISYCNEVKANWNIDEIKITEDKKEKVQMQKIQEEMLIEQNSTNECQGSDHNQWTNCMGSRSTENGFTYIGHFKNGKIIKGTALYPGNSKYVGQFKNDEPHGQGTFTFSDGSKYYGEWKNGKSNGNGTRTWRDGRKYSGKFKNDEPHGLGTIIYSDGAKYVGEWENGKRHGKGTLTYPDGETYIGQFAAGAAYGEGVCINQDGSSVECTILKMGKGTTSEGKNRHSIKIEAKKWVKISDYETATGAGKKIMDKLKNDFDLKALELCAPTGNFDILKKRIENLEIDETPAIGLEPKIKMGISGVVECK